MYLPRFPSQGFAVTGHIDGQKNSRIFVNEVLPGGPAFNEGVRSIKCTHSAVVAPDL